MPNTPNWTGAWSLVTVYNPYDLASYQGSTWIALVGGAGNIPGQTSQWSLFAGAGQNAINAWEGTWDSLTVYQAFNAVSYNNASYISLVNINQGNFPSSSPTQWAVLATAGGPGPAGEFIFTGVWSALTTYVLNDIVSYNGSSYVATGTPVFGVPPTTDITHWALIAEVGAQGPGGSQGIQGVIGPGFVWLGAWSNTTSYVLNDVVGLLGSSYVAVAANLGVNPSTDSGSFWQLMALAGQNGTNVLVLQTNGIGNTDQNKLNLLGAGTVAVTTDAFGNVTITGTGGTAPVTSVFGRVGVITAQSGDYSAFYDALGAAPAAQAAAEAASVPVAKQQTVRVPYTPTITDATNGYVNLPVVFNTPFADANYTLTTDLELATSLIPAWQANFMYAPQSYILDSNGMLQYTAAGGTSGGTQPVWNTVFDETSPTDGTIADWTLMAIADNDFIGVAKFKTAAGFTEEFIVSLAGVPIILHVTAWHD